jgi:adenine deaminase
MKEYQRISGKIVDVINREIYSGEITIGDGKIIEIKRTSKSADQYIIPGFIDAHIHIESSMLIPSEFARIAVNHGTVATVSDPHEIANVLGVEGVKYMIDNGKKVPFKFYFGAPSCVPATKFETAGAEIDALAISKLLASDDIYYLAEMMNFPGVLNKEPEVMAKLKAAVQAKKPIDGHAPGLTGEMAEQYIAADISTDHECFTREEALFKLKHGMKIIIREGSAAKNFNALIDLIDEYPDKIMFCSDDKHPNELVKGHLNEIAERAIGKGKDLFDVLRALSLNPIQHYKLDVGLLREGDAADFVLVEDLKKFKNIATFIAGEVVSEAGKSSILSIKESRPNNFNCEKIQATALRVKNSGGKFRVIEALDGQLITNELAYEADPASAFLESDIHKDVLKLVVVNRYLNSSPAIAFVKNFGLKRGAIASSVAHDSHNIIAVGVSDEDLSEAINAIIECRGGVSFFNNKELKVLPLPVAGLMSAEDGYEVAAQYQLLDEMAKSAGSTLSAPYMTLSFLALLVIPMLKLSDKGLFDGSNFSFVPLFPSEKGSI